MQANLTMSRLHSLYAAEDAAISAGNEAVADYLADERYTYECRLISQKPHDLETCMLAMDVLAWRFGDGGTNLSPDDARTIRPIVEAARAELSANGVTLPFLISIRAALKASPKDESEWPSRSLDVDVIELLENVLKWAGAPQEIGKKVLPIRIARSDLDYN